MLRKTITALCLASCVFARTVAAQESTPVFKSSVAVVPISAVVRDGRGRTITTLRVSDFEVRDNGELRPILAFQIDETAPLTIAVLVDTSGSMQLESKLASAREVVAELAVDLRDGIDTVGLFTFDAALHELHTFTEHPALLDTALTDVAPFGVTSLYDAVAETARRVDARPPGRRAVIVLTDGVDTNSALGPAEASSRASAIDVPVYVVATVPKIDQANYVERASSRNARSAADAQDLALWTGGDLLWATNRSTAASAARRILSDLRHQYLIGVDSAVDGVWRRLEVRVRNHRLSVRARNGYFSSDDRSAR